MTEQEKQFFDLLAQSMAAAAHKGQAEVALALRARESWHRSRKEKKGTRK